MFQTPVHDDSGTSADVEMDPCREPENDTQCSSENIFVTASESVNTESENVNLENMRVKCESLELELKKRDEEIKNCKQVISKQHKDLKKNISKVKLEKNKVIGLEIKIKNLAKEVSDCKSLSNKLKIKFSLDNVKLKAEDLTYYTGFENIESFEAFYSLVIPVKFKNPARESETSSKRQSPVISVDNELLLVLCKLRQNFDNIDLAARFGISRQLVGRICNAWINYLYNKLGNLNIWPHRDIILAHAPPRFYKTISKHLCYS